MVQYVEVSQSVNIPSANDGQAEQGTFAELFGRYVDKLKRVVAGMGLSASDGDDVLQEVYLSGMKQVRQWTGREELGRWLIRVTINRCIQEHRQKSRFQRHARQIVDRLVKNPKRVARPDELAIRTEQLEAVRQTLKGLDDSLQGPLVLKYFCGLNAGEIGNILQLTHSTVRSRLRKARLILADKLLKKGIEGI